jgi:hypothetical protein
MGMLKPASNTHAFAKVGLYGNAGSGKTYTAALIAIGLAKASKSDKPVGFFDTEPAAGWVKPLFDKAKVPLLVYDESRALADLMRFMDEAEPMCSVIIVDSITHVWRDAQESYLKKVNAGLAKRGKKELNALEFQHWRPIKSAWAEFTDRFLSSKVHVIVCGRAGNIYEYQKNETTGKKELITTGTKMATEKELGYEPSLLIEMIADREAGKIVNLALVQKDRADRLNGEEIPSPTFEKLRPHFDSLNLGGAHFESMDKRDSTELYTEAGDDRWSDESRLRTILSEEIQGLMQTRWPGQSASDKAARLDVMERFFGTRSWTKISESTHSDKLRAGLDSLKDWMDSLLPPGQEPPADVAA